MVEIRTYFMDETGGLFGVSRCDGDPHSDTRIEVKKVRPVSEFIVYLRDKYGDVTEVDGEWESAYSIPNGWSMPKRRNVASVRRVL